MVELIITIATLAILIMAWGRVSKGIDWTGARIGETGDMLSDLTVSGSKQTARGVIISDDTLQDTIQESVKKKQKRVKEQTAFLSKLSEDEKKAVTSHEAYVKNMIKRS